MVVVVLVLVVASPPSVAVAGALPSLLGSGPASGAFAGFIPRRPEPCHIIIAEIACCYQSGTPPKNPGVSLHAQLPLRAHLAVAKARRTIICPRAGTHQPTTGGSQPTSRLGGRLVGSRSRRSRRFPRRLRINSVASCLLFAAVSSGLGRRLRRRDPIAARRAVRHATREHFWWQATRKTLRGRWRSAPNSYSALRQQNHNREHQHCKFFFPYAGVVYPRACVHRSTAQTAECDIEAEAPRKTL